MYNGARVPSPPDGPDGVSTSRPQPDRGGVRGTESAPVKKAHREIRDHERKRRMELKCLELQEMMEEQGYSEEEITQKVGTFRHMLMEKEGVITRPDSCQPSSNSHAPYEIEGSREGVAPAEGYMADCECCVHFCQGDSVSHSNYSPPLQMKRGSSSSISPHPQRNKKRKHSRRFDSSSPPRKERKRRSGRKHKRCRSGSGARRKRRHRSGSSKNTNKAKSKQRKRLPVGSPDRKLHHRGSCCSSHSGWADRPSPPCSRPVSRHGAESLRSSCGGSPSPTPLTPPVDPPTVWQNGHRDGTGHSRDRSRDHSPDRSGGQESQDESEPIRASVSLRGRDAEVASGLPVLPGEASSGDERSPSAFPREGAGRRGTQRESRSSSRCTDSSPSRRGHSQRSKNTRPKRTKGRRSSRRRHRRRARTRRHGSSASRRHGSSASPARRGRPNRDGGRGFPTKRPHHRGSSRSSSRSASRSCSRGPGSHTEPPNAKPSTAREKDGDGRAPHTDSENRAHHRSRSYSPIRKRRSDSPSFMEARRITSARKRPIPYYRPSPSSPSSLSSCSTVRGSSRSQASRSPSRNGSSYSRGSSESPAF